MAKYAVVINNVVNNIIIAENLEIAKQVTPIGDIVEVKENDIVRINDTYTIENGFVTHLPPIKQLTEEERKALLGTQANND